MAREVSLKSAAFQFILVMVLFGFIYFMLWGNFPSHETSAKVTASSATAPSQVINNQYQKIGDTITIEVPRDYNPQATKVIHINWTGINQQKWSIIWHANITGINQFYHKAQRQNRAGKNFGETAIIAPQNQREEDQETFVEIIKGIQQYQDQCPLGETAWCLLEMTQRGEKYTSDQQSKGVKEYWRYPIEALADGGDCEDTAGLLAVMLKEAGYDSSIIIINDDIANEGHMAVGINAKQVRDTWYVSHYYKPIFSAVNNRQELLLDTTTIMRPNELDSIDNLTPTNRITAEFNVKNMPIELDQKPDLPFDESAASILSTGNNKVNRPHTVTTTVKTNTPAAIVTSDVNDLISPNTGESCTSLINNRAQDMIFWNYVENNNILSAINEQTQACHLKTASAANSLLQKSPDPGSQTMNGLKKTLISACVPCQDPNSAQPGRTREIVANFNRLSSGYNQDYQYCIKAAGISSY